MNDTSHLAHGRIRSVLPWLLGVLAALAGVAIVVWIRHAAGSETTPELRDLVAAVGKRRVVAARLVGGFAYGPRDAPMRGATATTANVDVRLAIARIEKRAETESSSAVREALGVAAIVSRDFDRAVDVLEDAVGKDPDNPRLLTDLGAAYLSRAEEPSRADDLVRAVELSARAVTLAGATPLPEASFNVALGVSRLHLGRQAVSAWQSYLQQERDAGWAAEIRRLSAEAEPRALPALADLRAALESRADAHDVSSLSALVTANGHDCRELFDIELLPEWVRLLTENRAAASRRTDRIRLIAEALTSTTGDRLPIDSIAAVDAAMRDTRQAEALAAGHRRLADARRREDLDDRARALADFQAADAALSIARTPAALWAKVRLADAAIAAGRFDEALGALARARVEADAHGYLLIRGLTDSLSGLVYAARGELARSLDHYQRALGAFDRVLDVPSAVHVSGLIAQSYFLLNERTEAWQWRLRALESLDRVRSRRIRHGLISSAVRMLLQDGQPHAALLFQTAEINDSSDPVSALVGAEQYLQRARIGTLVGDRSAALRDLARSRRLLADAGSPSDQAEAELLLQEALADKDATAARNLERVDAAIEKLVRQGAQYRLADAYLLRARIEHSRGAIDATERDLQRAIDAFERQRRLLNRDQLRIDFAEQGADLYTAMIRLQWFDRHRATSALDFAERGRSRSLLDALDVGGIDPNRASREIQRLPPGSVMLYYVVLEDHVLAWTVGADGLQLTDIPVVRGQLESQTSRLRKAIERKAEREAVQHAAADLFDVVIRPVLDRLPRDAQLIVVPDRVLHDVPFAALFDIRRGRYLIEDHALVTTPSLSVFLAASARRPAPSNAALVVAGSSVDPRAGMPRLPGTEPEARAVAAFYPSADLLVGDAATKARFVAAAPQRSIVHFAGHSLANAAQPRLSRLLFARDGDQLSDSMLFAYELEGLRFTATRVVVLAACESGKGYAARGEGVVNLARMFLAGGVPSVVATLWQLDDTAATPFFVAVHDALRRGASPAVATQRAAIAALHSTDPELQAPALWAGVIVVGGLPQ